MADEPVNSTAPSTDDAHEEEHAFRTYASDVAKLTGKPLEKNVKNETAPPKAPLPAPEPPPAKIIPHAPSTKETREEVLARLKRRAQPVEPPPNVAESIAPVPKAPSTKESREEVLARLRTHASADASARETPPAPPRNTPELPTRPEPHKEPSQQTGPARIHTYKTDFAEKSEREGASRISMLAAQQDAGGKPAPVVLKEKPKSRTLLYVGGALLIVAGVGSIYAAYRFATGTPPIPSEIIVPSLIFADERAELRGSGKELQEALAGLSETPLSDGGVAIAYISSSSSTPQGILNVPATGGAFVRALELAAPDLLIRNTDEHSVAGVVRAGEETRPFLILSVTSFERTFAAMLEWEGTMARDLAVFYPSFPEELGEAATTSASTTTSVRAFAPIFVDQVVGNRDARVLKDAEGRTRMLYGYRDKRTLIIARNEAAFLELLERLAASRAR